MPPRHAKVSPPDFESQLKRLEAIVEELDKGSLPLDKAMALFEEGQSLSKSCAGQLDQAESKLQVLIRSQRDGGRERALELGPEDDIDAVLGDALTDGEDAADGDSSG